MSWLRHPRFWRAVYVVGVFAWGMGAGAAYTTVSTAAGVAMTLAWGLWAAMYVGSRPDAW